MVSMFHVIAHDPDMLTQRVGCEYNRLVTYEIKNEIFNIHSFNMIILTRK